MENQNDISVFFENLSESYHNQSFIKLTLSKPTSENTDLKNVYVRIVEIKSITKLSFCYRYKTRDETKNYELQEGVAKISEMFKTQFLNVDLFTTKADYSLQLNKKKRTKLIRKPASISETTSISHDKEKKRYIETVQNIYLQNLGVTNSFGEVNVGMYDKFKQINKFIEIIDDLVTSAAFTNEIQVADMGSGKGYLTFALYDYLKNNLKLDVHIQGVEYQDKLVAFCNNVAKKADFSNLTFIKSSIQDFDFPKLDMLIALHACDTATDDAIFKGIRSGASVIVCAPCCHKQVRRDMVIDGDVKAILRHGILEERQAEILTDGIRALLLEANGYKTKVFEFISNEHTGKNLMIAAVKSSENADKFKIYSQIETLKFMYGIKRHYLEEKLSA